MSRLFQIFEQILRPSPFELVIGAALQQLRTRPALICERTPQQLSTGGIMHSGHLPPLLPKPNRQLLPNPRFYVIQYVAAARVGDVGDEPETLI